MRWKCEAVLRKCGTCSEKIKKCSVGDGEWETDRQTDRQIDRQTDRHTDR